MGNARTWYGTVLADGFETGPAPSAGETFDAASDLVLAATGAGKTLGCAESCTGGLVAAAITACAGSSAAFLGGVVSYACSVKESVLGVTGDTLASVGAVSEACVREMAAGVRKVLACDMAVSVSGIAGPGGAVPGKPVGTVWFCCTGPAGERTLHRRFSGDRAEVRSKAVLTALALLREHVASATA